MYSILAGCAIALGSFVNLYIGGGIAGAVLFSIGLILICSFNWELYTGRVGTISINKKSLFMLCGNCRCRFGFLDPVQCSSSRCGKYRYSCPYAA